jgi:site-specific DNA recombinase
MVAREPEGLGERDRLVVPGTGQKQKRCALYLRVSTERNGLSTQEAECRAYAANQGWEVLEEHVYRETFSGAYLWERPELTRLRAAMVRGQFDVLLVHDLDRLSREVHHQGLIFSEAERCGVEWDTVVGRVISSS